MAKKQTGRPRQEIPTKNVQIRLPEDVIDALDALAEENRRERNQEIRIAIEDRLRQAGKWPRDDKDHSGKK